jgi:hypothetical protein
MLSYDDLKQVVSDLSYKPGWVFNVGQDMLGYGSRQYALFIRAQVQDSRVSEPRMIEFILQRFIPEYIHTVAQFLSWWKAVLREAEDHEMREFARYQGELIDDPHASKPVQLNSPV